MLNSSCGSARATSEIAEALTWTVDKAQRIIDQYLARKGILAANAIQKLEDHRDKMIRDAKEAAN